MEVFNINFCCFNTLYVAIVPANACQHTKFQLSSSISLGDVRGVRKQKVGAPNFPIRPYS